MLRTTAPLIGALERIPHHRGTRMADTGSLHALHRLLSTKKRGDLISQAEILRATGWASSTLRTYVRKNKLLPFLTELRDEDFAAARAGSGVTYSEIHGALAQKTSVPLILGPGLTLRGRSHTYLDRKSVV